MINFVAAIGENNEMGFEDHLPWPHHAQKADLKRYAELINNKKVVIGGRTYLEYKDARKSLGTDQILVVTNDKKALPDASVVSLDEIKKIAITEDLWVIGGASIFSQLLPVADYLYLTRIHASFAADTFFPEFNDSEWQTVQSQDFPADESNIYPYTFLKLKRQNKNNNYLNHKSEFEKILDAYQPGKEVLGMLQKIKLVILTAPTGSGRNTIINRLIATGKYNFMVSDTTRKPRVNNGVLEQNGREYWFRSEDEMLNDLKEGKFLEAAIIHNQQVSGISIRELEKLAGDEKIAINEIEIIGADHLHKIKSDTTFIFLLPPSFDIWMQRLKARGEMSADELQRRLVSAQAELRSALEKDYFNLVVNQELEQTTKEVNSIVHGHALSDTHRLKARQVASDLLQAVNEFLND
jgi:dihydrofolate reductase